MLRPVPGPSIDPARVLAQRVALLNCFQATERLTLDVAVHTSLELEAALGRGVALGRSVGALVVD